MMTDKTPCYTLRSQLQARRSNCCFVWKKNPASDSVSTSGHLSRGHRARHARQDLVIAMEQKPAGTGIVMMFLMIP